MSTSDFFKYRIKMEKVFTIMVELGFLIILCTLYPSNVNGVTKIICLSLFGFIIVVSIIVTINHILKSNKYSDKELETICNELDNKTEKYFPKLGVYFTKNYVVCMGPINPFRVFAVKLDKIEMINTFYYMRHDFYKSEKKRKRDRSLLDFIGFSVKHSVYHPKSSNDSFKVFDLLCDDKLYRITTYHYLNKKKKKYVDEVVNYFSKLLPDIRYM